MPMTPANDISTQPPGNGGTPIPPNNNINTSPPSNQAATISTIKRDSSQQQLQQLQQYSQQQQSSSLAKAQLVCRPNSHPFPVSRQSFAFCAFLTNIFFFVLEPKSSSRAHQAGEDRSRHCTHKSQRQQCNLRLQGVVTKSRRIVVRRRQVLSQGESVCECEDTTLNLRIF